MNMCWNHFGPVRVDGGYGCVAVRVLITCIRYTWYTMLRCIQQQLYVLLLVLNSHKYFHVICEQESRRKRAPSRSMYRNTGRVVHVKRIVQNEGTWVSAVPGGSLPILTHTRRGRARTSRRSRRPAPSLLRCCRGEPHRENTKASLIVQKTSTTTMAARGPNVL